MKKAWDNLEELLLVELIKQGKTYREIGSKLSRTERSVTLKAKRLGFKYSDFNVRPKQKCLQCGTEYKGELDRKFCSRSCSAKYNLPGRVLSKTTKKKIGKSVSKVKSKHSYFEKSECECACCGDKFLKKNLYNKYCSSRCYGKHKFFSVVIPKFEKGEVHDRKTLRRIISERVGYNCSCCGISEWNGRPIVLQVDHKDGNPGNDKPDNLRLICPNCHSQTDSFSGKNKGKGRKARGLPR